MPKVVSGFDALQEQILFAVLQGNSNLLNQLTQSQLGKAVFMRVYKDNFWFMDNDSTAMNAILNSSTAMNAIANSSTAMNAIANSSTAMRAIIESQTALDAIFANTNARDAFISSKALPSKQVPQMISNTTPEGQASASSIWSSSYDAWRAFDKGTGYWISANGVSTNQWVRYSFISPVFVHTVRIQNSSDGPSRNIKIQYSSGGSNWLDATNTITLPNNTTEQVFYVSKAGYYRHWRVFVIDGYTTSYVALQEVNFVGFLQPQGG